MGLGFVIIIWVVIGSILAGIGACVCGGVTAFLTRGAKDSRGKVVLAACAFPFACLVWAGIVFVIQAAVNIGLLHRDPGIGDGWDCPLPNGYAISMIDVTDQGTVYNPKTQTVPGGISSQDDVADCVRIMQVTPRYILGGVDSKAYDHLGTNSDQIDGYFILDTQVGKRTDIPTLDVLHLAASQLGIQLNLEPIATIYSRYRFTWFDILSAFLLFAPPLIVAGLMVRWILRLRRVREIPAATHQ
jgi:hypothetical protein